MPAPASSPRHQPGFLSPDLPWTARDVTAAGRTVLLGLVLLSVGWIGGSGTVVLSRQAAWLGVGALGTLVAGTGLVGWLLSGLRQVRLVKQDVVAAVIRRWPDQPAPAPAQLGTGLVSVPGATRYHRADCRLVAGKTTSRALKGLAACGVCIKDSA